MISFALTWLRRLERAVAMSLLIGIFAIVFVATIGRYMGSPVIWAIEVTQAMFVWLCVLAADVTLQHYGHFSVPALADLLPPEKRRILDIFNALVVLAVLAFLARYGVTFADFSSQRPLPMTGVSEGIATAALPVGFSLMFITVLEQLIMRLKSAEEPDMVEPRDVM
ncbi:MAG TPA: TRAP transporter small permease [Hyphomicrobiales bacterium]|nr:TRAP transporter small permease [Hyphomicrobiales bacterium]